MHEDPTTSNHGWLLTLLVAAFPAAARIVVSVLDYLSKRDDRRRTEKERKPRAKAHKHGK